MRYKINIKLLISGLIFSSFAFAGNQSASLEDIDSNACLDNKACSKMLEISLETKTQLIKKHQMIYQPKV